MKLWYEQRTGRLSGLSGAVYQGYSGYGRWKNNPEYEFAHGVGPIPAGEYYIHGPYDDKLHGPVCFTLSPDRDTETFGRLGLMIHGDNGEHIGNSSHGCIVLPREAREAIARTRPIILEVLEGTEGDANATT